MIKKISIFIVIAFLPANYLFSKNLNNDMEGYFKIDKEEEIIKFYERDIIKHRKNIWDRLDELYLNKKDEEAIDYVNNLNLKEYEKSDYYFYYSYLISEKCLNEECKLRLKKFFNKVYDLTDNIEMYSSILSFDKLFNEKEIIEILTFLKERNSMKALNYQNIREGRKFALEDVELAKKIKLENLYYNTLIEKIYNNWDIKILFEDGTREAYFYIKGLNRKYLRSIGKITIFDTVTLKFIDINNDKIKEVVVEKTGNNIDNSIFIFSIKEDKLLEFKAEDMDLSKYFKLAKKENKFIKEISDDFGNISFFEYELPNREEYYSLMIEDRKIRTFFILNDKIYMRIMNNANFEIILNTELKEKLKIIEHDNNYLNLSNSF